MSEKEAYYFSHDSNARNDIKVIRLRRQLGLEGYGIYWCIIEMLREAAPEYKLSLASVEDIAYEINISREKVEAVINSYGLFVIDDDNFFSRRLAASMEKYNSYKGSLSEAGKIGMAKRWGKKEEKKMHM